MVTSSRYVYKQTVVSACTTCKLWDTQSTYCKEADVVLSLTVLLLLYEIFRDNFYILYIVIAMHYLLRSFSYAKFQHQYSEGTEYFCKQCRATVGALFQSQKSRTLRHKAAVLKCQRTWSWVKGSSVFSIFRRGAGHRAISRTSTAAAAAALNMKNVQKFSIECKNIKILKCRVACRQVSTASYRVEILLHHCATLC